MRRIRGIALAAAAVAVVGIVTVACTDHDITRPPIPTIAAQQIETFCAEWTCSYDTCWDRPDYDGNACCLERTTNIGYAQPEPNCSAPPPHTGECGPNDFGGPWSCPGTDGYDGYSCNIQYACCSGTDGSCPPPPWEQNGP